MPSATLPADPANARPVSHAAAIAPRWGTAAREAPILFGRDLLAVQTPAGVVPFSVEVASTPRQQRYGLMHRRALPPDAGMLFLWPRDRPVAMWMKDTPLPLDMLFIDGHGRVAYIAAQATPLSTKIISAHQPVRAVLEVLGGTAALRGIGVGDQVLYPYFAP